MKKPILLFAIICFSISAFAQRSYKVVKAEKHMNPELKELQYHGEIEEQVIPKSAAVIGTTIYDMQTNSSVARRLEVHGDGSMSATWTMGFESASGYPDRGTGYNYFDGSAWGAIPSSRIESMRAGWPDLVSLNNTDVVVSHDFATLELILNQNSAFGNNDWNESVLGDGVWPRMAVGGTDGNTIHLIAHTYDAFQGMDQALVYYRSPDGGQTWDITGTIINGIGPSKYQYISGDQYAIDASGETVAIAVFSSIGDVAVVKSTDNGDSWTRYTVIDFPDQYEPFNPDTDVFDVDDDGNPDTTSKSDGSGAVIIDNDGKVHVATGLWLGYYDAGNYFYPALCDGIVYWNEDMPEGEFSDDFIVAPSTVYLHNNLDTIAKMPDPNGNGEPDWAVDDPSTTFFGEYQTSLTCHPQFAVDEYNNLCMVYSSVMEEYYKDNASPNLQHFRHVFAKIRYSDYNSWSGSLNLVQETGLDNNSENVFPMIGRSFELDIIGANIHAIWQSDNEPGITLNDNNEPTTTNSIVYNSFYYWDNVQEIKSSIQFNVYPNPAREVIHVSVKKPSLINIYNMTGSLVFSTKKPKDNHRIDVSGLPNGAYMVKVNDFNAIGVKKFIKQ